MNALALVIENDAGTRKLLNVLLSRIGFEVDTVPNGPAAMLLLREVQYSLVFADVLLPAPEGRDLLHWIVAERRDILPHLVVLSSGSPVQLQSIRDAWPEMQVFRKPFELDEVIAAAQVQGRSRREPVAHSEQFIRRSVHAGAKSGVIVKKNGSYLERVLDFGYARELASSYFPLQVASPMPLCASIRDARSVWLTSPGEALSEYPNLDSVFAATQTRALASVPLMRDGEVIGAAGWSFPAPRQFTDAEQQLFGSIAESVVEWLPADPS